MLKLDREQTRSVPDTVPAVSSALITGNTMALQTKLNKRGCRLLAIAVIKASIHDAKTKEDFNFFGSDAFHFWAGLAYGGKTDYRSDDDIINDILKGDMEKELQRGCGRLSKWS